ncbi:T9SS type A sorting domain-containing protein [Ferruginibacter albus]|uniref:T9SS type A sorting domain-containing protein n=1 Tax=Ferruginibacter albus TaxID=2875540 RepID=UPI001CC43EF8|nr:T9SS type A sorting domain-containing protein [Ferruginibacter albus]UAY51398.1 T9SS type A sorting domain-containing protein [Ferruginibacter albus]
MKFVLNFFIALFFITTIQAQCPPGASGIEVRNPTCTGGCGVLLQGWPPGVIVNIFTAVPLDSIGSSGVIGPSGAAFVCIPCHQDLIFASNVPNALNGCVIIYNVVLPVTLNNFTVNAVNEKNILNWNVSSESGYTSYIIQKSIDGNSFTDIGTLKAKNAAAVKTYSYTDESFMEASLYYRIKIVDVAGDIKYSSVVSVKAPITSVIKVINNSFTGSISINTPPEVLPAIVSLYDQQGRMIYTSTMTQTISSINTSFKKGIYILKVTGSDKIPVVQKIIVAGTR